MSAEMRMLFVRLLCKAWLFYTM